MFPFDIEGELEIEPLRAEQTEHVVLDLIAQLVSLRATDIERAGDAVSFRGGMFRFASSWNLLNPVSRGRIEVIGSAGRVRYAFSCAQLLVLVTLVSAAMGAFVGFANRGPRLGFAGLFLGLGVWVWLFGMNYLVGRFRLRRFVRGLADASGSAPAHTSRRRTG